jgi:hypothetical protein
MLLGAWQHGRVTPVWLAWMLSLSMLHLGVTIYTTPLLQYRGINAMILVYSQLEMSMPIYPSDNFFGQVPPLP